jgi:hypothetical protein
LRQRDDIRAVCISGVCCGGDCREIGRRIACLEKISCVVDQLNVDMRAGTRRRLEEEFGCGFERGRCGAKHDDLAAVCRRALCASAASVRRMGTDALCLASASSTTGPSVEQVSNTACELLLSVRSAARVWVATASVNPPARSAAVSTPAPADDPATIPLIHSDANKDV